ncbi:hypothetical protein C5F64_01215 [Photobacterium damselae subsp. damselae]|uniref:Phage-related membrane protein n=1 Tax=Photobacterium damselae subsp. damselae TaxID=85581 RepID=A0A850QW86_PHODD|nr:hypothetical protein [Photobacterium damselae]NVP02896.1 hypothetical protein [Photobacterium damselae subsp. damselae]PSB91256.1 hypothetical protein C5F64_01215 [Photobacterium damselae subsp. damselae]TGZ34912.1 hypothetical protein EQ875_01701 [Photobacterium damselae subsp. damselae]
MALLDVVQLYRLIGDTKLVENQFEGEIQLTTQSIDAITAADNSQFGRFESIDVNGDDIDLQHDSLCNYENEKAIITFRVSSKSAERFYKSIDDLLASCLLIKEGSLPNSFYIVEDDLYYDKQSNTKNKQIEKIKNLCLLIEKLTELAHYHDKKNPCEAKLVFVPTDTDKNKPIVIAPNLEKSMLSNGIKDLSVLTELTDTKAKQSTHYNEKMNVLVSTLSEFLQNTSSSKLAFQKLINSWSEFLELYNNNIATYLSGFAFHKAKKEIAEAEVKLAEQLANITSDITGKLFSIPVSLAAVVTIASNKTNSFTDYILLFGLILMAAIIIGIVDNQSSRLSVITQAKDLLEKSFEGKKNEYPNDLNDAISEMNKTLDSNITKAKKWLKIFIFLGITPFYLGLFFLSFKS